MLPCKQRVKLTLYYLRMTRSFRLIWLYVCFSYINRVFYSFHHILLWSVVLHNDYILDDIASSVQHKLIMTACKWLEVTSVLVDDALGTFTCALTRRPSWMFSWKHNSLSLNSRTSALVNRNTMTNACMSAYMCVCEGRDVAQNPQAHSSVIMTLYCSGWNQTLSFYWLSWWESTVCFTL